MNGLVNFFGDIVDMSLDMKNDYLSQNINSIQYYSQVGNGSANPPPTNLVDRYDLIRNSSMVHLKLPGLDTVGQLRLVSQHLKQNYKDVLVVLHTLKEVKKLQSNYPEFKFVSARQVSNWGGSAQDAPSKSDFVVVIGYMSYEDHLRNSFVRMASHHLYDRSVNDQNYLILFMG